MHNAPVYKTSKEIRRENFLKLWKEYRRRCEGVHVTPTQAGFYKTCGFTRGMGAQLWKRYSEIGEKIARKIEVAWDLPQGWMDVEHPEPFEAPTEEIEAARWMLATFWSISPERRRNFLENLKSLGLDLGNT